MISMMFEPRMVDLKIMIGSAKTQKYLSEAAVVTCEVWYLVNKWINNIIFRIQNSQEGRQRWSITTAQLRIWETVTKNKVSVWRTCHHSKTSWLVTSGDITHVTKLQEKNILAYSALKMNMRLAYCVAEDLSINVGVMCNSISSYETSLPRIVWGLNKVDCRIIRNMLEIIL